MSAYVVRRSHIDALVRTAIDGPAAVEGSPPREGSGRWHRWTVYHDHDHDHGYEVSWQTADNIGRMLWTENVASVAYRYPADEPTNRPGPLDFSDAEVEAYTYGYTPG